MVARNSGGQARILLTPVERRQYVRWWLTKSGLSLRRIAIGMGFAAGTDERRTLEGPPHRVCSLFALPLERRYGEGASSDKRGLDERPAFTLRTSPEVDSYPRRSVL